MAKQTTITEEKINAEISRLQAEQQDFKRQAEQIMAEYNGRIKALKELLNPPKPAEKAAKE